MEKTKKIYRRGRRGAAEVAEKSGPPPSSGGQAGGVPYKR
jgi:hypothetical protein